MSNLYISSDFSGLDALIPQGRRVFVVIDSNLKPFFGLFERYELIPIQTSEKVKTLATVEYIIEQLLDRGADRSSFLVGVGGGITTDLCGFAASVYKRGIRFGFVPTTLLAQVDASIGGKNGVNFHAYKNMVGTITQPEWIYICTDALRTLSPREFRAGIAEVLKTFILFDAEYYRKAVDYFARMEAHLRKAGTCCGGECVYGQEELTEIIRKTALYKCAVVERDAFEKGERRLLNLGHTLGHSIEKNSNFTLSHGHAVAIGMHLIAKVAERRGLAEKGLAETIRQALLHNNLPTSTSYTAEEIAAGVLKDKKRRGGEISFVLPTKIGHCEIVKIPTEEVLDLVRTALA